MSVIRFVKSCIPQTAASYAMILAALTLSLVGLIALQKLTLGDGETAKLAKAIVNKQAASILIALAVMVVLGRVNYLILGRYSFAAYIVSLVLLFLLLVFGFLGKYSSFFAMLVPRDQNSYRWINLGFYHLQPSEFFKFTYILALAWYLRYRKNSRRFSGLVGPFVFTLLPMMLIVLEPDLGTTMLLFPVLMVMVWSARMLLECRRLMEMALAPTVDASGESAMSAKRKLARRRLSTTSRSVNSGSDSLPMMILRMG
jgi:rod shape determining protein RodA